MRKVDKIRQILNILFLAGALLTFILWAADSHGMAFKITGFTSLGIKAIDFLLRFINSATHQIFITQSLVQTLQSFSARERE